MAMRWQWLGVALLGLALATLAGGCAPNVPNPIGVGSGRLALLLDEQGAYHSTMNKPGRIYLTDKQASFVRELPDAHNPIGWLSLSPDGQRLLYLAAEEFKEVEGEDYVEVERWGLRLYDLAAQTESRLVESEGRITAPTFSPQGDKIAYLLNEPQTPSQRLHILDLASQEESVVESEYEDVGHYVWDYRWSGDGQSILLLRSYESEDQNEQVPPLFLTSLELYTLAEDEEEGDLEMLLYALSPLLLTLGPLSPLPFDALDWSPDGRRILLVTSAPLFLEGVGYLQLYLLELDEELTGVVRVRLLAENAVFPSFSPQGDRLAFIGAEGPIHLDPDLGNPDADRSWIYLGDGQGENLRRIAGPGCFTQLFWVSEDELGYVEETEDGAIIWIHDLSSGERFNLSAELAERLGAQ